MTGEPFQHDEPPPLPTEAPVLHELAQVGVRCSSISALRESGSRYVEAVPVLVRWLGAAGDDHALKEELVRALSVPWAREALPALLREFQDLRNPETRRWTVGNALSIVAGSPSVPMLTSLALDRRYGAARQMLVLRLGRAKDDDSLDALLALADDPDVDGHVVDALARRRSARAVDVLRAKVDDPRAWVARAARRGLAVWEGER